MIALQGFLASVGAWALVPIFLVVTLESSAFLGLLFPGEMVALIAGALAAAQAFSPWLAFATVASAAVLGDVAGYALGHYWGQAVLDRWPFACRQYQRHRGRLESYFELWGSATVLIGRFVAVGRAFVPFAAGLSEMPGRRFIPVAIIAGVLWGGVVVALGFVLGSNWRLVEGWLTSLGAGILILFGITILMVLLWRWLARRQSEIAAAWQRRAQRYGIDLAPLLEFIEVRLSPRGYLVRSSSYSRFDRSRRAGVAVRQHHAGYLRPGSTGCDRSESCPLDRAASHVRARLRCVRNRLLQQFMVDALPDRSCRRRLGAAGDLSLSITAAAVLGGAYGLALGLQSVFSTFSPQVPPTELVHGFTGFPSVTVTAATAAYGMAFYSFAVQSQSWRLQTLGAVATLYVILLIGLDTLYAGQMLSAAIGGFASGGCWLAICVTAHITYQRLRSLSA